MKTRGFTLIELLVVISIFGLLASVILASLAGAKLHAKDAAVQLGLKEVADQIETDYTDGAYGSLLVSQPCPTIGTSIFVTNANLAALVAAVVVNSGTANCATGNPIVGATVATSWAVSAALPSHATGGGGDGSGYYWCVDSRGKSQISYVSRGPWYMPVLETVATVAHAIVGPPAHGNVNGGNTAAYCS